MTLSELQAQVALGGDSRRQFKQDMQSQDAPAAFANSEGGVIFLRVADDGSLPGVRLAGVSRLNQMISNVAAQHVRSPLTVHTENVDLENGRLVIALTVPRGIDKPYFDRYGVIAATLFDVLARFEDFAPRGKNLNAILMTHNGRPNEVLLGILTLYDLPKVLDTPGLVGFAAT